MSSKANTHLQADMAEESEEYRGCGLVAYFDLLGFSQVVMEEWAGDLDDETHPLQRLLRIRQGEGIATEGIVIQYADQDRFKTRVFSISDSFALVIEVPGTRSWDFSLAFLAIANNARFVTQAALDEGFIVRGAIEFGDMY